MKRFEVYSRFVRRHLQTREERAVYFTLTGQKSGSWSARELAERNHLDRVATERALEAFEATGFVDAIDAPGGRRYRWRSDMSYLSGHEGDPSASIDPVCGMRVVASSPFVADDHFGRPRSFCSSLCLAAFRAFPSAFAGPAPVDVRKAV